MKGRIKALLCHEMRTMRFIMLIGVIMVAVCGLIMWLAMNLNDYFNSYSQLLNSSSYYNNISGTGGSFFCTILQPLLQRGAIAGVFVIAGLTIWQFADQKTGANREFIASLPFRKSELFLTKTLLGIVTILITGGILWIVLAIIHESYIEQILKFNTVFRGYDVIRGNETLMNVSILVGIFTLTLLATYLFFVMVHSLVNRGVLSALIGIGVAIAPAGIYVTGNTVLASLLSNSFSIGDHEHTIFRLTTLFGSALGEISRVADTSDSCSSLSYVVFSEDAGIGILILAGIGIVSFVVAFYVNRTLDLARSNRFMPYKGVRIVFVVGFSLCVGLLTSYLTSYFAGLVTKDITVILLSLLIGFALPAIILGRKLCFEKKDAKEGAI